MVGSREITNRKSIFPLQPMGLPSPKSGVVPRSRTGSDVVVLALPPPEPLSSVVVVPVVPELLEPEDDPPDEPSGTVVIGIVVNADESEVGA
jgi:hypothetical protein